MNWKLQPHGRRAILLSLILVGCSKPPPPNFPDRLKAYPTPSSNAGFDRLLQAAEIVEESCSQYMAKATLTIGEKRRAIELSAQAVEQLRGAVDPIPTFVYSPISPLQAAPHRRGWYFLGNVMVWKARSQFDAGEADAACATAIIAIRFGLAISGGDSYDMNLGYSIIDSAAKELWERMVAASPAALQKVYNQLLGALKAAPTMQLSIRNETSKMLSAVNAIQDAFLKSELQKFGDALGTPYRPAFDYLDKLKSASNSEQTDYFDSFAARAAAISNRVTEVTNQPTQSWASVSVEKASENWWRLAEVYFSQIAKMPDWYLRSQTQLRILAVRAALTARLLSGQRIPADLSRLPALARTDVYTGHDLKYLPQGSEFSLYSVGPDRRDDGGDGGMNGLSPDLVFGR